MVVLMRLTLISLALLATTASSPAKAGHHVAPGPAEAGHYLADVASGFSQTMTSVASGFSQTIAPVVSGFSQTPEPRIIEISAERFSFNPSEIRVKAGTTLEIRLTSEDTMHGFHIVGTDINLELPKRGRGVASVTFQPTSGRYEFQCSRLCGAGHSFMRGVIIAE
jgi:plastocyanin